MIKLKGAKHSILLPGDATGVTWDTFNAGGPNAGKDLSSDIFLISHHGSATHGCTTLDLLNKIKPKMCLISAGLMHNHPRKETLDILFQYFEQDTAPYRTKNHLVTGFEGKKLRNYLTNIPIFTTIDNGRLSINLSQKLLTLNTSRDFFYVPSDSLAADGDDPDLLFDVVDNRDFKLKNDFIGADNLTEVTDEIYKTQEGTHWLKRKNLYFKLDPYLYDGENDSSSDEYSDSDGED